MVLRNPKKVNPDDQLFPADLTKKDEALNAVAGSDIVYLTLGLPYSTKVWMAVRSVLMNNLIREIIAAYYNN